MSFNSNRSSRDGKPNKMNKSNNDNRFNKDRGSRSTGSSSSSSRDGSNRPFDKDRKAGKDSTNPRERFGKSDDKRSSDRKPFNTDRKPYESDRKSFGSDRDQKPRTDGRYSDRPERGERSEGGSFEKKSYGSDRKSFGSDRKTYGSDRDQKPRSEGKYGDRPERGERSDDRSSEKKSYGSDRKSFGSDRKSFGSDRDQKPRSEGRYADRPERGERREGGSFEKKPFNRAPKSFSGRPERSESTEGRSFDRKPFDRTEDTRPKRSDKPFVKRDVDRSAPRKRSEGKDFSTPKVKGKDDGSMRLNRYIANAGVCSRRKADELIEAGVVSVNGEVITSLGTKVDPAKDDVRYNGERLKREKMVYVLLNKPKDYITTTDDPQERKTVMHLVDKATNERIYPVGRLDRNTTGLLLMTNDGALAEKLSHPRNSITKIYHVELDKPFTQGDLNKLRFGIELEDGLIKPDDVNYVQGASKKEIGIQIHSGKNRIVRRIFESLGYDVVKLDRVIYANLTKKDLTRGRWRYLDEREIVQLKHFIK